MCLLNDAQIILQYKTRCDLKTAGFSFFIIDTHRL